MFRGSASYLSTPLCCCMIIWHQCACYRLICSAVLQFIYLFWFIYLFCFIYWLCLVAFINIWHKYACNISICSGVCRWFTYCAVLSATSFDIYAFIISQYFQGLWLSFIFSAMWSTSLFGINVVTICSGALLVVYLLFYVFYMIIWYQCACYTSICSGVLPFIYLLCRVVCVIT